MAFFYILMEWIFFVTKPSFMTILSLGEKIKILLIAGFAAAAISLLTLPLFFLLDGILSPVLPFFRKIACHIPAAFLGACLSLILIDNFTYTVFKFGIVNSTTLVRIVYALVFLILFAFILRKIAADTALAIKQPSNRFTARTAIVLCGVALLLTLFSYQPNDVASAAVKQKTAAATNPNIILLSTDGLNADHMSVYGYGRETTPFISQLAATSLISENHFTNAGHTMGSETAVLTGKLAMSTRVLFPPDTLKEADKYEHLPGVLKQMGYRSVELGVPYFVDANTIDFQNAFDEINCKQNTTNQTSNPWMGLGYDDDFYLLTTVTGRINDRLGHIFFVKEMENPMAQVTGTSEDISDEQRLDCLETYLTESKHSGQPLFAQVHMMGTHGFKFDPAVQVFSTGEEQTQNWMTDFYDDSILAFDDQVKQLVQYLKDNGQYDNTILVLYSDHGQHWTSLKKIPLIIHFPGDQHPGVVNENTQNIDIAPTVLNAMGIPKPTWMQGTSLLAKPDPERLIVSARTSIMGPESTGEFAIIEELVKPPFYQFTEMTVIQCQRYYLINLEKMSWGTGEIAGYSHPCSADALDSQAVIRGKVGDLLIRLGYNLPANW